MSDRPVITEAEAAATIANPLWRLRNLYKIRDKAGRVIDFRPNWVQEQLLHAIHVERCRRILVLKSRKHGVSTLFELLLLDWAYFVQHVQASIIDLTAPNAQEKLKNIVRFAWENLDGDIREAPVRDNNTTLEWANGSNINAGKQARGGQNQILHISEWGPIAHEDPERSEEIKTGALPSADEGVILIESTFKGGKGGDFYELIKRCQETPASQRTAKDYRLFFFAWWQDERNTLEGDVKWIPEAVAKYLAELEAKIGRRLTDGQKLWYFKTKQEQGIFMGQEYPSTIEEALNAIVEGSIFGAIMSELRAAGRITVATRAPRSPCFACWDLGWNDSLSVWIFQMMGRDLVWLWHRTARHETMAQMYEEIERSQIPVMGHVLPHDGKNGNVVSGATSPKVALENAGAVNVIVLDQPRDEWTPIDNLRDYLARSWFEAKACEYGITALEAYHTKDESSNGVTSKNPVHDWSSHPCKAAIYGAMALEQGLLKPEMARQIQVAPRDPEGNVIVDLEQIRRRNRLGRSMLARSGTRRQ